MLSLLNFLVIPETSAGNNRMEGKHLIFDVFIYLFIYIYCIFLMTDHLEFRLKLQIDSFWTEILPTKPIFCSPST